MFSNKLQKKEVPLSLLLVIKELAALSTGKKKENNTYTVDLFKE